tara:strand:- start:33 stop:551 length:519 start_codon:yes stop_codon:yes gene_type:complete
MINELHMRMIIILILFLFCILNGSDQVTQSKAKPFADYQLSSEKYITGSNGNIMMKVNIWGQVGNPGSHLVYEGIDFASLISLVGGPVDGANFKKVRLFRELPDANGKLVYNLNLDKFIQTGDRSNFIKINPNDTIIIPKKLTTQLIQQVGTINTLFSVVIIYLQITLLASR